jgi:hypothetical protein
MLTLSLEWAIAAGALAMLLGALLARLYRWQVERDRVPRVMFDAVSAELTSVQERFALPHSVTAAAKAITRDCERLDAGGEYKRHQAYAKLIGQFPDMPKRDLAFAIELALRP